MKATAAILAVLTTLLVGSALMLAAGANPAEVWWALVTRVAGDPYALGQVGYRATTLVFVALAALVALEVGCFHIGAEGQLVAGCLAAGVVGGALPADTAAPLAILLSLGAAAAAGAGVGLGIGVLRARYAVHEVVAGFLSNAILAGLALWLGDAWWFQDGTTRTAPIVVGAELPHLGAGGSAFNVAVVLALVCALGCGVVRARTSWGLAARAVGQGPKAAAAAGVSVARVQVVAMTAAGALAGLAASNLVLGHKHAFEDGLGRGAGFVGIAVALLARRSVPGVLVAAVALAWLGQGGLLVADLVPKEIGELLIASAMLAAVVAGPVARRLEARA